MHVLLVDDDPELRDTLVDVLREHGHAAAAVPTAQSALAAAAERMPDVVVVDLVLPDSPGFTLVEQLRALPGGEGVPVVAISGFREMIAEARASGLPVNEYLAKPLSAGALVAAVRRAGADRARELRKIRHDLAGHVMVLHALGEKDLAERCRATVAELDRRIQQLRATS